MQRNNRITERRPEIKKTTEWVTTNR